MARFITIPRGKQLFSGEHGARPLRGDRHGGASPIGYAWSRLDYLGRVDGVFAPEPTMEVTDHDPRRRGRDRYVGPIEELRSSR